MNQICRVDVVQRTERVVHHGYDVVFFENSSPVDRVEDLLEVGFYELDDQEYLLEVAQVNVLEIIQLVLDEFAGGHRVNISILTLMLLGHAYLCKIEAWRNNIVQLRAEYVVLHECELAQNLYLTEDLSGRVLVVKTIAYLFNRNFFL